MRPHDPAFLKDLMNGVEDAIARGVNPNTAAGEDSAWRRYYLPYCARLRTAAYRGFEAASHPMRESAFLCGFVLDTWRKMRPRRRTDTAPRVESVRNVLGHVRRRIERAGQTLVATKMVSHLLRGIARQRIAEHGIALPVRAEPFTAAQNVKLKSVPATTFVGGQQRSKQFWAGWRLVDTYGDQAGSRKKEIVGWPDIRFNRSDAQIVLDGEHIADPSPEQLQAMAPMRDKVTMANNVSKADFDGTRFGPSLVSLLYNPDNPMSFAAAFVQYELAYPLRGAARLRTPMFTTDGVTAWTENLIDSTLTAVMRATLTSDERKGKTFHSKRVWVATGLGALDSSEAEIQALVRWSTVESLRIYSRMNLDYQARRRDLLHTAQIDVLNATRRPNIGDGPERAEETAELQRLADHLDSE